MWSCADTHACVCRPAATAALSAIPVRNNKGLCVNTKSATHAITFRVPSAATGVSLKTIVFSSLRLGGAAPHDEPPRTWYLDPRIYELDSARPAQHRKAAPPPVMNLQ